MPDYKHCEASFGVPFPPFPNRMPPSTKTRVQIQWEREPEGKSPLISIKVLKFKIYPYQDYN